MYTPPKHVGRGNWCSAPDMEECKKTTPTRAGVSPLSPEMLWGRGRGRREVTISRGAAAGVPYVPGDVNNNAGKGTHPCSPMMHPPVRD